MNLVDICFNSIQGRDILITEQSSRIKSLVKSLKSEIREEGPLSGTDMLMMVSHDDVVGNISTTEGTFVVLVSSIHIIIENCGIAAEETFMGLDASKQTHCNQLRASLHLNALQNISALSTERTQYNAPATSVFPVVVPS